MRYILLFIIETVTVCCTVTDSKNITTDNFPTSWTMLRFENANTLRYKDCSNKILGVEIFKKTNSTDRTIVFTWSMGNDSSTIKKFEKLDPNHYYIITDKDSVDIELGDIDQGIATFHHAGQQRDQATTYMDSKKADKYKLTNYTCDE